MKGRERPPWSRLRYLFHGWTVSHGLSPIAKPLCTKARRRSEPQRGGVIVARGKPRFAAPPRGTRTREHDGRARDSVPNRRSPSPTQAAHSLASFRRRYSHRDMARPGSHEAGYGSWRARRLPVVLMVVGSPAVRGAFADPGWRRKARLTPGYGETAALRLRRKTRVSRIREFKWDGTHSAH